MPLGIEVGLGPRDIVLDGDPAPPPRKGAQWAPLFGPCLLWAHGRPSQQLLEFLYVVEHGVKTHTHMLQNATGVFLGSCGNGSELCVCVWKVAVLWLSA